MFESLNGSTLDRRSFLRGSALFAAAIGVSVLPAFAQQQPPQQPAKPEEDEKKKEEPKDPSTPARRKRRSSSTTKAASTACARSAPTTCISRAACGCARTAVIATSNKAPSNYFAIGVLTHRALDDFSNRASGGRSFRYDGALHRLNLVSMWLDHLTLVLFYRCAAVQTSQTGAHRRQSPDPRLDR